MVKKNVESEGMEKDISVYLSICIYQQSLNFYNCEKSNISTMIGKDFTLSFSNSQIKQTKEIIYIYIYLMIWTALLTSLIFWRLCLQWKETCTVFKDTWNAYKIWSQTWP